MLCAGRNPGTVGTVVAVTAVVVVLVVLMVVEVRNVRPAVMVRRSTEVVVVIEIVCVID